MPAKAGLSAAQAKEAVISALAQGAMVKTAMAGVNRSIGTWENWRSSDPDFKRRADQVRTQRDQAVSAEKPADVYQLDFVAWRKRYLGRDTYPHQQMWIDVLEGREPDVFHSSLRYEPGRPNRLLITTPPFHSKSTVLSQEYIAYRICRQPNIRVILVSKTAEQAKKFLYSIKKILTSPEYAQLQAAYAPGADGFKEKGQPWSSTKIYIAGRDGAEKDPTVEALGMGGHIYGARADLIVLDDVVTLSNAGEYLKQIDWLNQEVSSRAKNGKILVVGTRVASTDLYSELRNGDNFVSGKSPWTYLGQPAVLEMTEDPADWKTLWPRSNAPLDEEGDETPDENGLYAAWDGKALSDVRESVKPKTWSLIYQQQDVAEDATFHPSCVWGSVDRRRSPGPLRAGALGHPRHGQEGMHVIGSIDPAGTGEAFVMVIAVDRIKRERWVLNAWGRSNTNPRWYAEMIEQITPEYQVNQWVMESNGYASWALQDDRIVAYLRDRGIPFTGHYSSRNKTDPDFGVASMASLFGTVKRLHEGAGREVYNDDNVIHLPDPDGAEGIKMLLEQLITWVPGKRGKDLRQDGPMCLWFAELKARLMLNPAGERVQHFIQNPYASRRDRAQRTVIPVQFLTESA